VRSGIRQDPPLSSFEPICRFCWDAEPIHPGSGWSWPRGGPENRAVKKLVPFDRDRLALNQALPFGLYESEGRLLLAAGQSISSPDRLQELLANEVCADADEVASWERRMGAAVDEALRTNGTLGAVAKAQPKQAAQAALDPRASAALPDQWEELVSALDGALRDVQPGEPWLAQAQAVQARARQLGQRRADACLYYLVYTCGDTVSSYSSRHALLTMLVMERAGELLGWSPEQCEAAGSAALTMNVSMSRLQDLLAEADLSPTEQMREQIDAHPERAVELLQHAGVTDAVWLEAVRHHHAPEQPEEVIAELPLEMQVARLLRRVDIFTAKMSRRRVRPPMSPVRAAKEACIGADGRPDLFGQALIKALGLYPPGSFVELNSGELGVVVSRGKRANLPLVASLVTSTGAPLGEPILRDTALPRFAVKSSVNRTRVKVRPSHTRLIALI
jgi:HD-GYP domain-containing protein (c-di-GMP phosphodiesterase class II)